uniref:Uncharacterized protein n=1 Tax=Parascaris univalens TaxID=6257 RepID=A0A915C1A0_PARUN
MEIVQLMKRERGGVVVAVAKGDGLGQRSVGQFTADCCCRCRDRERRFEVAARFIDHLDVKLCVCALAQCRFELDAHPQ